MKKKEIKCPQSIQEKIPFLKDKVNELNSQLADAYSFVCLTDFVQRGFSLTSIRSSSHSRDFGCVFRVVVGGRNFEIAFNNLTENVMDQRLHVFVQDVQSKIKKISSSDINNYYYTSPTWKEEKKFYGDVGVGSYLSDDLKKQDWVHFSSSFEENLHDWNSEDSFHYLENLREVVNRLDEKNQLIQSLFSLRMKDQSSLFIDNERVMTQTLLKSLFYCEVFTQKGRNNRIVSGGLGGKECIFVSEDDLKDLIETAYRLDEAQFLKPGVYQVLSGPDVTGVIAHEAFGHTQEGDTCRYGRSVAPSLRESRQKVGNEQASIVNYAGVFDMGECAYGQNGSHFFDHEGCLAREHLILDKGYLGTPMNDLLSAIRTKGERQSNGKRESWRRPIMSRQTNTYFTYGMDRLEDLIRQIDYGFIAEHAHGGMEDPKGMSLTAGTSYLREVKNGQLTGQLFLGPQGGHIELNGYVPDMLMNIQGKSSQEGCSLIPTQKWGGCGKYHKELVEAGSGGPWILWKNIVCG